MVDQHDLLTEAAKATSPTLIATSSLAGLVDWQTGVLMPTIVNSSAPTLTLVPVQ